MYTYIPEKFASLYATPLGQRIWAFLTEREQVARLETASYLSKPAVEGIEEAILERFGADALEDRVKQMVGHMTRQILEQNGWVLDATDVKVQSIPFAKAARYRRPDWVTFHAFRNSGDPRDVVLTDRRQGAPLPEGIRWVFFATFASPLKATVAFGIKDIQALRQHVHAHGYQRVHTGRIMRSA